VSVSNPEEIDEVFDKISYKKGASLIRMLHSLMGEEPFKQGIRCYTRAAKSRIISVEPEP
jgi:aminopeptidase N